AEELGSAAAVVLDSARRRGEGAVMDALRAASSPAATAVLDELGSAGHRDGAVRDENGGVRDEPARVATDLAPQESAADWLRGASQELARLRQTADRPTAKALGRLERALGDDGTATVVAAAAAGVEGAAADV